MVSGISRTQKWTDRNPASSRQSLISGNVHLNHSITPLMMLKINIMHNKTKKAIEDWEILSITFTSKMKNPFYELMFEKEQTIQEIKNLQPPAVWKCMAKFSLFLLHMKMEANPCLPLNNIKFSLLPYILQIWLQTLHHKIHTGEYSQLQHW